MHRPEARRERRRKSDERDRGRGIEAGELSETIVYQRQQMVEAVNLLETIGCEIAKFARSDLGLGAVDSQLRRERPCRLVTAER